MLFRWISSWNFTKFAKACLFVNTERMSFLSKMYPVSSLSYGMFWFISHQKTLFPEAKYFRRFAQSSTTFTI